MSQQLALQFDHKIAKSFMEYHAANPDVYRYFKRFAFELINRGAKHLGGKMIMERIRFETAVRVDDSPFKANNSYTSFYVRLFAREYPRYAELFETRRSKADAEITHAV